MNGCDRVDVAVVGGGPAGAVTALLLARAGAAVALYEQSRYDQLRLGETLPPSVNPLLRQLGLWDRFRSLDSEPSYQTASVWGDDEPRERSCVFSPYGHGWHVDRARFDQMLSAAAADAGARVLSAMRVRSVVRTDDGVHVDAPRPIRAGTVVDATGRSALIARALGAHRHRLDRLVCAGRVYSGPDDPVGDTFIEAVVDGWWYTSPLPGNRRLIALFADAQHATRARVSTVSGWTADLARTDRTRGLASGVPDDRIHLVSCASHELRPCVGSGWIAVGDAALAVDPLSSGGVAFALRTAAAAADVLLSGNRSGYETLVANEAREYRKLRAQIYGWERRFDQSEFWVARTHEGHEGREGHEDHPRA